VRFLTRNKAQLAGLLGGRCELCGYDRCLRALQFHHVDPATKRFNIAGGHCRSWKSLAAEVQKCALLCATCHIEVEDGVTQLPSAVIQRAYLASRAGERRKPRPPGRPRFPESRAREG
jgi:hypothetical protein